ncbi:MAG: hypothetical protein PUP46_11005 [Endozoicomonas sp. (ex Botrylloides leachii)]|nr:hypothetical protein [Endozoicomonas sp. (ex Botrylloides leachii)]
MIGTEGLTDVFLLATLTTLLFACFCKARNKLPAFTQYTPTLLTSLGILGTFTGIVAGLLSFDTTNIDKSIGPLLAGLKTAFITSIVGMLASIIYKVIISSNLLTLKNVQDTNTPDEISANDLYNVMKQQAQGIKQLQAAIGGDHEASLVGQIKLMRSNINDGQRTDQQQHQQLLSTVTQLLTLSENQKIAFTNFETALWEQLQNFSNILAKSATEQVIEALKEVIAEFNNNLTEQFGENFKQLNDAVHELVIWQDNYKIQLADMKTQYDTSVKAITLTEQSVAHISEKAEAIPKTMDNLSTVIEVNQHQVNELSNHLDVFVGIRDKAVSALPEIHQQIETTLSTAQQASNTMASGVDDCTKTLTRAISHSAKQYQTATEATQNILEESTRITTDGSEKIQQTFSTTLTVIDDKTRMMVDRLIEDSNSINNHLTAAGQQLIKDIRIGGEQFNKHYTEAGEQLLKETSTTSDAFQISIKSIQGALSKAIEEQAIKQASECDRIFAQLDKTLQNTFIESSKDMKAHIETIDKTMETEINNVMSSMGNALASISGQFTEDYSKLINQMNQITQQARQKDLS